MEHWFQDMVAVAFELAWEWMVCGKAVGAQARFWNDVIYILVLLIFLVVVRERELRTDCAWRNI